MFATGFLIFEWHLMMFQTECSLFTSIYLADLIRKPSSLCDFLAFCSVGFPRQVECLTAKMPMLQCYFQGACWSSKLQGGRKRLPKFKFSAKFPIGLHVILQIQIKKFENDCYLMWKIILTENPSRCNLAPHLK